MADENDKANEVAPAKKKGPGGKNPFVAMLLLINAGLMGTVAYFQYQAHLREKNRPDLMDVVKAYNEKLSDEDKVIEGEVTKKESDGELMQLDPFTANLSQGDGPKRFVRLNAVLKFTKDSNQEEFKARMAQIRDSIISILNSKRPEDLLKIEGKAFLKEEIKASINSFFVDGSVSDIYYTSFQIN